MEFCDISDLLTETEQSEILQESKKHETPHIIFHLEILRKNFKLFKKLYHYADIFYAVKANSNPQVLKLLVDLGASFDVASTYELDMVLDEGASPDKISYGNPIVTSKEIIEAYQKGVRLYVCHDSNTLNKLSKYAPKSKVFFRLLIPSDQSIHHTAVIPLTDKFGCDDKTALSLVRKAVSSDLEPYGLSFHVGSQQSDIKAWDRSIERVKNVFDLAKNSGINLKMINLGGGYPGNYADYLSISDYADPILKSINHHFGTVREDLRVIVEPGRSLVAKSGVLGCRVKSLAYKDPNSPPWLFLDAGTFNGLIERMDGEIPYFIYATDLEKFLNDNSKSKVSLGGPTCDGADILIKEVNIPTSYLDHLKNMSSEEQEEIYVYFLAIGAYANECASQSFNGLPPIKTYIIS